MINGIRPSYSSGLIKDVVRSSVQAPVFDKKHLKKAREHNELFCFVKTSGYNKKNKSKIEYSSLGPVPHLAKILVPNFVQLHSLQDHIIS